MIPFRASAVVIAALVSTTLIAMPAEARSDRLYISTEDRTAIIDGQPMWMIAARCAAIEDNIEARFVFERAGTEEYIRKYPDSAYMRDEFEAGRARMRELSQGRRNRMALFGALRAGTDRPGAPGATTFEAEAARQLAQMRAQPFQTMDDLNAVERACGRFMSQMAHDILPRMHAKRPDRPGPNG